MLKWFTKGIRSRAALALVLAYTLCVLAPAAAFALSKSVHAAHCLTGDHYSDAQTPGHSHTAGHIHSSDPHSSNVHSSNPHSSHAHAMGAAHDHATAAAIEHASRTAQASADEEKGQLADGKCCGLMCVPAIPASLIELAIRLPATTPVQTTAVHLTGRGPERLSRPPDSSLSL